MNLAAQLFRPFFRRLPHCCSSPPRSEIIQTVISFFSRQQTENMSPLDLFFRTGNTALLVLLAIILIKNHHHRPSAILGAVFATCVAGIHMLTITLEWEWPLLEVPLNLLVAASPFVFWLLAKSLFEDTFRWKWSYLLVYAVYMASGIVGHYITFGDFRGLVHWFLRSDLAHDGIGLLPFILINTALVVLALYAALRDWRVDLVESRRRARMVSVSIGAVIILGVNAVEFFSLGTARSSVVDTSFSGALFLLILVICTVGLGFRTGHSVQPAPLAFPSETPEEVEAAEGINGTAVIGELERLMGEEKIFREEDFTIRRLADRLEVKEYRLRRLINGHLGYRNFNLFLNRYRIEEVARQLVGPETRHLPVLSIALDNGYRSLSPFNKAFKEIKGMTPTEYRSRHRP
jgi:AraC-like DNA-binding protein